MSSRQCDTAHTHDSTDMDRTDNRQRGRITNLWFVYELAGLAEKGSCCVKATLPYRAITITPMMGI